MKEYIRVYYYFIIGAVGGLTGWFIGTLLLRSLSSTLAAGQQSISHQALYGAALGAAIGVSVAAYDGLVSRSLARFIKFGGIGFLLGSLAGALALPLAQWLYGRLLASSAASQTPNVLPIWKSILVGTICWVLFGGLIGLGEGISKGTQSWKGLLGGTIGGVVGGMIYEINRVSSDAVNLSYRRQLFLAISFALLGAAISAAIALVIAALKQAWIEVLDGKFAGRTFDVTKYVDPKLGVHRSGIIGSDQWSSHVYLPGDNEVLAHHAEISFANGAPTLTVRPEAAKRASTFVNGRKVSACPLSDGDRLQVGSTKLIYHQKRR